jgi:nicotinamide-nucleotide amidase
MSLPRPPLTDADLARLAQRAGEQLRAAGRRVSLAESCTGGWVAKMLTDIPGCSQWFERGYVTYSNEAKQQVLGVQAATLEAFGAVSRETVREMAAGALAASSADMAVAISGIAGPDGGTTEKPVGLVWFGIAECRERIEGREESHQFAGDRDMVRRAAVACALELMIAAAGGS